MLLVEQRQIFLFFKGADLSYVNELQDGGVKYYKDGTEIDPYNMLKKYGGNLVRLRLWHNPTSWTNYSTLEDVKRSIKRTKQAGLNVLLDFHYSDSWTDPEKNLVPEAWRSEERRVGKECRSRWSPY